MKTLFKFLGIMAFLLVAGCQKTDDDFLQEGISLQETKTFFEKQEAEKEKNGIDFEITPKWETFMQGGENREGNFSASVEVIVNQGDFKKGVLFILQKGKTIRAQILIKERILENVENQMLVFDLQGVLKKVFYVEKGKLKRRNVKHTPRSSTSRTTTKEYIYELEPVYVYGQGSDTPDRYHIMELIRYYDSFMDYPEQGSGESDDSNYREENDRDYSIKPRGGNRNTPPKPEQIIDQITDEKIKCLHDKLRKGNNDYVKEIFSKFEGNGADFDIVISSKDKVIGRQGTEVNGITKYTRGDKTIYIEISESKAVGRSALDVAKTIFHEYIHADIFRKLENPNKVIRDDFASVLSQYALERQSNQHDIMANLYIPTLQKGIQRFHKEQMPKEYEYVKNLFNDRLTEELFYEALAWQGIKHHGMEAYTKIPDDKKQIMENDAAQIIKYDLTKTAPCQ
ncbi:hypothetical protein ACIRNY_05030 [Capnocytophaga canimorsus]|uniref:Uncharacterized protein n=1 Tax=Capnocytophaga canimorsus (strain 5) TaxID=860228 RepID=F9YSS1_CAPCC|nr:hypothetical protein [Capnocytophaga canimorsus]AEK23916.1 Conserved hypothetical protein [Capnocytophaga canimorsus Cc5]GIM59618.1 hypothetical protein CAPN007_18270 [Capnocytophaga canimorsus]